SGFILYALHGAQIAGFDAGRAFDAQLLVDAVRLLLFAGNGAHGAGGNADSASLALDRGDFRTEQGLSLAGGAAFFVDVLLVLLAEVAQRREHGIGRRFAEAAQRPELHRAPELFEQVEGLRRAAALDYIVEQGQELFGAFAAENALSARLA